MKTTTYHHARVLTAARGTLATLFLVAAALLAYRIIRASESGWVDLATSVGTAVLVIGSLTTGWLLHARRLSARAEAAEWENARLRRAETLLDGDEDRALWDSVPAAESVEDTCAFGTDLIPLNQYRRWGRQAG